MTTNKPPIAAWAPSTALHKLESHHNNAPCILTDGPAEFNDVALVRLDDYEALQAELEQWKNGSAIRDEQNEELHQYVLELKTEIENLRSAMIEAKGHISHYMYGGSSYREPAAEAVAIIDATMEDKP